MREDRGRLLSALIASLGDFELAEEALSDALESALTHWARTGIPDSPIGWLLTVARRKAIDRIRRQKRFSGFNAEITHLAKMDEQDANADAPNIPDERLRLIFTCCHPALAPKTRVALTLRTIGGLSTGEIAAAFLDSETAMGQRLSRARKKISTAGIPYTPPEPEMWGERLASVLAVIYLIFNQGYAATSGTTPTRVDLCDEAIFLARLLDQLQPNEPEIEGLLALLLTTHARRAARQDRRGITVALADQDRALWDREMLGQGLELLDCAIARGASGPYQIKAAISALHVAAMSEAATDWRQIVLLYDSLLRFEPTPVVALNRATALAEAGGLEQALQEFSRLKDDLVDYQPYHAACAEYLARAGSHEASQVAYERAIALSGNDADRQFLRDRRDRANGR
ncbi:MAG: RNA polymerase [Marinosulfonomonas sp.]|nr:RNA polymerase [Marinosulfonomonas sp.]